MSEVPNDPSLQDAEHIVHELYVPFAEIPRQISWPGNPERMENDAEHSQGLAMLAGPLAARLGLDPLRATALAVWHDMVERYAGDTSVWAEQTELDSKAAREAAAVLEIKRKFPADMWLHEIIYDYETGGSEEARFVRALDKLHATMMIVAGEGRFWKDRGVTFARHLAMVEIVRPKVAQCPVVLAWYDELMSRLAEDPDRYFAQPLP